MLVYVSRLIDLINKNPKVSSENKKKYEQFLTKNEKFFHESYCLYGLLIFVVEVLERKIKPKQQIKMMSMLNMMLLLYSRSSSKKQQTIQNFVDIFHHERLSTAGGSSSTTTGEPSKIVDYLDTVQSVQGIDTIKNITHFHLQFEKEDFRHIFDLLKHLGVHGSPYFIGGALEQIMFISQVIHGKSAVPIPFSGSLFLPAGNQGAVTVNSNILADIEANIGDIMKNTFEAQLKDFKEGKSIEIWDFLKDDTVLTAIYIFKKAGLLGKTTFKLVISDESQVQAFLNFWKANAAALQLTPEQVKLEFYIIKFDKPATLSYMINAGGTPTDFNKYVKELISANQNNVKTPIACSRCIPSKPPAGWRSVPQYNIYAEKGVYKDDEGDKAIEIIYNYRGCNFGRMYILMYMMYYDFVKIE